MTDVIPAGWRQTTLGAVADLIMGQAPPGSASNHEGIGWPFVKAGEFGVLRPVIREWTTQPLKFAQEGDVLICVVGATAGKLNLGADCAIGRSVAAIRPREDVEQLFVYYQLLPQVLRLRSESAGSAQGVISSKDLARIPLLVPPLAEQRRIVDALEEHLSGLDAAVAGLERAQANIARYRASVLDKAVHAGGDPLPSGWRWTTLGEISDVQGGIQKQPKRTPTSNHYPFLRVANVHRGRLVLNEVHRIELFGAELSRLRLQRGDLLIVEGNGSAGEIGRMAIWDGSIENCVHQNHIIRARPHASVTSEYLAFYWNSPAGSRRVQTVASSTSGLHTLSVGKVSSIPVPLPPMDVQQSIASVVSSRLAVADRTAADIDVQLDRAARVRRAILQRAFLGRLVPKAAADEPSPALVVRIAGAPGA